MTQKNFISLLFLTLLISGCSLIPTKKVEIVSTPIEIDILQPDLPRPVQLTAPKWWVISEARIANPCKKVVQEDGTEKRPKACAKRAPTGFEDDPGPDSFHPHQATTYY